MGVEQEDGESKINRLHHVVQGDDVLTTFWTEIYKAAEEGTLESEEEFHPIPEQES